MWILIKNNIIISSWFDLLIIIDTKVSNLMGKHTWIYSINTLYERSKNSLYILVTSISGLQRKYGSHMNVYKHYCYRA